MKYLLPIIMLFPCLSSFATEKQYESYEQYERYEQIVDRLSSYRQKQVRSRVSTTIPRQNYHLSLGVSQGFVPLEISGLGDVSLQGLVVGGAIPLVGRSLFWEGFGKFYQTDQTNGFTTSLSQLETRITHKEPLSNFIGNFGVGASNKFIDVEGTGVNESTSIPSLVFLLGLERQITSQISLAGDLTYHRSMRGSDNAKHSYEAVLRLNYSL